jgi:hypothetical protein
MGVRFPSVATKTILNATLINNSEISVATTPPLNISLDFAMVMLFWFCLFSSGATTNVYDLFLRRGTGTSGTQINVLFDTACTGGAPIETSGFYFDTPGAVANQQYTLGINNHGGAGNGNVVDVALLAFSL